MKRAATVWRGDIEFWTGSTQTVTMGSPANLGLKMVIKNSGNVGIGTTAPSRPLHVIGTADIATFAGTSGIIEISNGGTRISGSSGLGLRGSGAGSDDVYIGSNGNVGIGTASPGNTLSIDGNGIWIDNPTNIGRTQISVIRSDAGNSYVRGSILMSRNGDVSWDGSFWDKTGGDFSEWTGILQRHDDISINTIPAGTSFADMANADFRSNYERLTIKMSTGNVGIGTTSPQSKLAVKGTITAQEIKVVDTSGWADYVFDEDYKLPSLESVEAFIKEKKHLPDIPPAEQIQNDGIAVSEILSKQMQKIEELTLYLIELKKDNEELRISGRELKKENEALKEMILARLDKLEKNQ